MCQSFRHKRNPLYLPTRQDTKKAASANKDTSIASEEPFTTLVYMNARNAMKEERPIYGWVGKTSDIQYIDIVASSWPILSGAEVGQYKSGVVAVQILHWCPHFKSKSDERENL